jgi:hypothetical protein
MLDKLRNLIRPERRSSDAMVSLAQRALRRPESITRAEVKSLAASVLSQAKTL